MIRFEELIINENELFSNGRSLEVTNFVTFKDVEFPDIIFNNHEIKTSTNKIKYDEAIRGQTISDGHELYFKNCSFSGKLEFNGLFNRYVRFDDCSFTDIFLKDIYYDNEKAINGFMFIGIKSISSITVDFCQFNGNIHINHDSTEKLTITNLTITNSVFEKDFSFHSCNIDEIKINDSDFNSLSEFNNCEFKEKFDLSEITYKGFTLFDDCDFLQKAEFEYVIFEKFASFRKSIFHQGINLDYTSSDKEIHFFGVSILENDNPEKNTSQETYRIIKYNFEKLGNKIEANKYHALELNQKKRELEKNKWQNFSEYLVFKIHDMSSEHSTNWNLALLWIVMVGFLTTILEKSPYLLNVLPLSFLFAFALFENIKSRLIVFLMFFALVLFFSNEIFLKDIMQNMSLINLNGTIKPEIKEATVQNWWNTLSWWSTLIVFLNKISLGYLYYQFLMSIRKDTRK